jgi:hypothetical protein
MLCFAAGSCSGRRNELQNFYVIDFLFEDMMGKCDSTKKTAPESVRNSF